MQDVNTTPCFRKDERRTKRKASEKVYFIIICKIFYILCSLFVHTSTNAGTVRLEFEYDPSINPAATLVLAFVIN